MTSTIKKIARFLLPLAVLIIGVFVMITLIKMKPKPKKIIRGMSAALVQAQVVKTRSRSVPITAFGEVKPARSVDLMPQVGGRIVEQHPQFVVGGRVRKGELLLRLEADDYTLSARRSRAQVAQAEQNIEMETGRRKVAEREWTLLGKSEGDKNARARALRKPQKRTAEASLAQAKASLRMARLSVGRTKIKAPFNALLLSESVDIGQVVSPSRAVGRLVGTDAFWIEVSVPVADLDWIQFPSGSTSGSPATIIHQAGERSLRREGRVIRRLADLGKIGRMARIIVEVADPLALDDPSLDPMLLGAYVQVQIAGKEIKNAIEVPRIALREGDKVWTAESVDHSQWPTATLDELAVRAQSLPGLSDAKFDGWRAEKQLNVSPVHVVRRLRDSVLVDRGLTSGDVLITSRLQLAIPGVLLRVMTKVDPEPHAERSP